MSSSNPFEPSSSNPFETPRAADEHLRASVAPGTLDIGVALREGWDSCWRNFWSWLAVTFVGGFAFLLSGATLIGIFVVWPVLFWGAVVFTLRALEGEATLGDFFSGFGNYGRTLGGMLGLQIMLFGLALPGVVPQWIAPFLGDEIGPVLFVVAYLWNYVWIFGVMARVYFAPFYLVEHGLGPVESLKVAWTSTSETKLMLALFYVVTFVVAGIGVLALLIGIIPAVFIIYGAWGSAYRQLSGTSAAPSAL